MNTETRPVILTAGRATRAGTYAPDGCKALVPLGGRPIIEWQMRCFAQEPLIVARAAHAEMLVGYGDVVVNDDCLGPGDALRSALPLCDGPITVVYADTFFTDVPEGSDWIGTAQGWGGRAWDVVHAAEEHGRYRPHVVYEEAHSEVTVCVGLYSFSNIAKLRDSANFWSGYHSRGMRREWGLSWIVNDLRDLRWEPIPSWRDVGSSADIQRWATDAA